MTQLLVLFHIVAFSQVVNALELEGYNCEYPEHIRVFSGREVERCKNFELDLKTEEKEGQVLQQRAGKPVEVKRCKVVEDVTLANCGHSGHLEGIYPDFPSTSLSLSASECVEVIRSRTYRYRGRSISVTLNATVEEMLYIKGSIQENGDKCTSGGYYSYRGYAAYDAVVPAVVTVTIGTLSGILDIASDKLIIANTFRCDYDQGFCADDQYGTLTWEVTRDPCTPAQFDELYSGTMTWFNSSSARGVVIEDDKRVAVVRPKKEVKLCGLTLTSTTIDDVFISNLQFDVPPSHGKADLFAYFETKLDYVYYKSQELSRHNLKWIAKALCEMEEETVKLKMRTVTDAPPGHLITMDEPGKAYMSAGEAIYEILCRKVTGIKIRETVACYRDLPVEVPTERYITTSARVPISPSSANTQGEYINLFLTPLSRILVSASAESVCSKIAPFAMELEHHWLTLNPNRAAMVQPAPFPLSFTQPDPQTYIPLLPEDTIYSAEEVAELSRSMRLPRVRDAVLTNIVRRMDGLSTAEDYDITRGITEQGLENLASSYAKKIYGVFSSFGTFCAGIFGIWIIYRIFYAVASTLFNCTAIYKVTGLSFKMLGAFCTSLTSYFLATTRQNRNDSENPTGGSTSQPVARHLLPIAHDPKPETSPEDVANRLRLVPSPTAPPNTPSRNIAINTDQTASEFELEVLPSSNVYPQVRNEAGDLYTPVN